MYRQLGKKVKKKVAQNDLLKIRIKRRKNINFFDTYNGHPSKIVIVQ